MKYKLRHLSICVLAVLLLICEFAHGSNSKNENFHSLSYFSIQQKTDSVLYRLKQKSDSLYEAKNYTLALKLALKVLDESNEEDDLKLIAETNFLIGKVWYETRSYEKAISYFQSSLKGYSKLKGKEINDLGLNNNLVLKNDLDILNNDFNVARSYHRLFEKSHVDKNDNLIKVNRDSSLYYYMNVVNSQPKNKEGNILKSKTFYNLSGLYFRDSIFDLAEDYAIKAIEIDKIYGDQYDVASDYNLLSNVHFSKKEYAKSKEALFAGIDALEKIKGEKADEIRAALFLNIAYSMYMLKDYEAYEYQEKSWNLYDEIKDRENQQKIADIYADRNYDKGLQEGIYQQEIQRQNAQKITLATGITSFFIIVLLVFLLKQYKLRQKNLGLELSRQELMQQQKLEKVKNESQIRILNATLDGKESERKQIAETLHDSVSALLSSANLHLQACKKQFNGATPIEVDKSQSIINEASQKIRDLSHTLVSSILLKFGLSYAIKDIAEKFSNSELKIDYETKYIKRYDQGFEIKLYNITQEFINNILKHSEASYAKITLVEKRKKLHLTIEDNGKGFHKTKIPEKDGLGINQIDARIQMMRGKFHIESGEGNGTLITIELPVFEKKLEVIS